MQTRTDTEVVIVGGGPVGLAAAVALGRLGVATLLVERHATTSTHPRGHVENGRSMELFRLWGVEDQVREQGVPRSSRSAVRFMTRLAGLELGSIRFAEDSEWLMGPNGKGPAALSSTPQDRLEPILLARAQQYPSVTTWFGCTLDDLSTGPDGVCATLHDPVGATDTVQASYAIAADGSRSPVREMLGIPVNGPGFLGAQLGIYFHADLSTFVGDHPAALYWLYNPEVQGVLIALDGGQRWHLLFAYNAERETPEDYPPQRCAAIVRALIGRDDIPIDIRHVLPWRMRAAVADQFQAGRVFLAGDAAHTMPPTGGMGMNTGIADVHNLAWKLHAVLRGHAGPELLDTYDTERHPVGQRNTDNSVANARTMAETGLAGIMTSDPDGFAAIERPEGAPLRERLAAAIPSQHDHFSFDGLSFGDIYDSNAIVSDGTTPPASEVGTYVPTAIPGARAPHLWLRHGDETLSTLDLSDGRFALLSAHRRWIQAARRTAEDLHISVGAYRIGDDDTADLADPYHLFPDTYHLSPDGAILIRPDGHIAWHSTTLADNPETVLTASLRSVLARTQRSPFAVTFGGSVYST